MEKHCFSFLEEGYGDICNEAMFCEKYLVEKKYFKSIIRAGITAEKITIYICKFEEIDYVQGSGQKKRLKMLLNGNVISDVLFKKLNHIRKIANKLINDNLNNLEENANIIHSYLYEICVYFYKTYNNSNFVAREYFGPIMGNYLKSNETNVDFVNGVNKRSNGQNSLNNYHFKKYKNSYLLNELSKLKNSSIEAVEDDDLTEFKEYLHVDRSIQNDFLKAVNLAVDSNSSHLIILCGSVGDGKSHLIANLKKNFPELFAQFNIQGDATESFDPKKDAIYTLASVLKSFNDNNINTSKEKFILAINLGVLNNFLESNYAIEDYTQLKSLIKNSGIFDSDKVSDSIYEEKFSFITFTDYNMFELNDDKDDNYTSSKYISALFNKITQKDETNPFYSAYLKDKELRCHSPIIYNYEMFMDGEVQKIIIDYLIKIFIKYQKIISTRDLLNFIYEIIVPPESLKNKDLNNINSFMEYSLPNLLFGSPKRSDLLKLCNDLDPTFYRNESLDQFIIDFNVKDNTKEILENYFDLTSFNLLNKYKEYLFNFKDFKDSEKEKIINILIRFSVFYGKNIIKNNFKDKVYLKYLKYLYAYNTKSFKNYMELFNETKEAIFNWKGRNEKNTICIDSLDSFKIYKNLKLKHIPDESVKQLSNDFSNNRFKTEIKIIFSLDSNKKEIYLNVDFSLYEYINKLKNGFKPNKSDKEDLIILNEFINNLLSEDSNKDLIVISLDSGERFSLESTQDIFEFKKEA